ncbi:hypothetical protein ACHWQZ_G003528 [Mnemiopsis leidyi]
MGADQSKSAGSDIVVVNEETSPVKTADKESAKKITSKVKPLLEHSASFGILASDHAALRQLNPRHMIELFTVYEEHLRQSTVVAAEEQNQLSRHLKETEQIVSQILAVAQKKHDVYGLWSKNIQSSVGETNEQLTAINTTLEGLVPLVNCLNELLPVDQRLPPFSQTPS